jgi:hypothetical protein
MMPLQIGCQAISDRFFADHFLKFLLNYSVF